MTNIVTVDFLLKNYAVQDASKQHSLNLEKYHLKDLDQLSKGDINYIIYQIAQLQLEPTQKEKENLLEKIKIKVSRVRTDLEYELENAGSNQTTLKNALKIVKDIQKQLEGVRFENVVVSHFKDDSIKGKVKRTFKKCIDPLVYELTSKSRKEVFLGWELTRAKKLAKLEKKFAELDAPISEKRAKLKGIEEQIIEKKQELKDKENAIRENNKFLRQEGRITQSELKHYQAQRKKLKESVEYTDRQIKSLNVRAGLLKMDIENLEEQPEIKGIREAVEKLRAHGFEKREKIRERLEAVGGERAKIVDHQSNSILDGMYLSADKFRENLSKIGVKKGQIGGVSGFLINKNDDKAWTLLKELGIERVGFSGSETDKFLFIYPEEEDDAVEDALACGENIQELDIDLTHKAAGGTVILAQGNMGVYEASKREILAFLLRGMNVMAANFSGYGDSTGIPSESALNSNMDAIYHHLQDYYPVDDNRLLIKALCLGGGPATHLAAKHPKTNLFLDQTYADFGKLAHDNLKEDIDEFVKKYHDKHPDQPVRKQLVTWGAKGVKLLSPAAKLITPNWKVKRDIAKVQGCVGILSTTEDKLIHEDRDIKTNMNAATSAVKVVRMKMLGEHATGWLDASAEEITALAEEMPTLEDVPRPEKVEKVIKKFTKRAKKEGLTSTLEEIWNSKKHRKSGLANMLQFTAFNFVRALNDNKIVDSKGFSDYVEREERFYVGDERDEKIAGKTIVFLRDFLSELFTVDVNKIRKEDLVKSGIKQVDQFLDLEEAKLKGNIFI